MSDFLCGSKVCTIVSMVTIVTTWHLETRESEVMHITSFHFNFTLFMMVTM